MNFTSLACVSSWEVFTAYLLTLLMQQHIFFLCLLIKVSEWNNHNHDSICIVECHKLLWSTLYFYLLATMAHRSSKFIQHYTKIPSSGGWQVVISNPTPDPPPILLFSRYKLTDHK